MRLKYLSLTSSIMNSSRWIALSLVVAVNLSPFHLYAQSDTGTVSSLTPPTQTTVFLTDTSKAKELTSESVANTYYSQQEVVFDEDTAAKKIEKLEQGVRKLRSQIITLDQKYGDEDDQYNETRKQVVAIIDDIEKTKDILSSSLTKIAFYKRSIVKTAEQVNAIRKTLDATKNYLQKLSVFMYKVNNEYYTDEGNIDDLKLFVKSDGSVSEQLANTALVEQLMHKMNTLLETLSIQEKETIKRIKVSNRNRSNTKSLVEEYNNRLNHLEDQTQFLSDYLTLYESNKAKIAQEFASLFDTQKDLYQDVITTVDQVQSKSYDTVSFDVETKLKELAVTEAYAQRDSNAAPLSRPLYPVTNLSKLFGDKEFEQEYEIPYYGIEIPATQRTPLYAVNEGLIYKIANREGMGLSWVLVIQKDGLLTVYLYPNEMIVSEGDIVRRGQIIGYSG